MFPGQGAILLNLVRRELAAGDILAVPAGSVVELISFSDDIRIRLMSSQSESCGIEGMPTDIVSANVAKQCNAAQLCQISWLLFYDNIC